MRPIQPFTVVSIAAVLLCSTASVARPATELTVSTSAAALAHFLPDTTSEDAEQLANPGPTDRISRAVSASGGPGGSNGGAASLGVGLGYFAGNVSTEVNFTGAEGGGIFQGEITRATGFARGTYRDEVAISHPGLAGQSGTLSATMAVSGSLLTGGNGRGSASWGLEKLVNTTFAQTFGFLNQSRTGDTVSTSGNNTGGDVLAIVAPFVFGQPFLVTAAFALSAGVGNTYQVGCCPVVSRFIQAQARFGNTAEWQGIDEILGPDGDVLDGVVVTSASGTDWSLPTGGTIPPQPPQPQVIPVPAALPLLLFALGLLCAVGLRRRPARGLSAWVTQILHPVLAIRRPVYRRLRQSGPCLGG